MRTAHSGYLRPPLVCVFLLTGFDPALAQQTGTPTVFEPIEFRSPGTNVWQRPAGARFALLWGCGGGGGGGRGEFEWGPSTVVAPEGGTGGGATIPTMKFAGPLTADSYTITVGRGGGSNQDGQATSFGAQGAQQTTYIFAGGVAGHFNRDNGTSSAGQSSEYGPGGSAGAPGSNGGSAIAFCAGGGGGGQPIWDGKRKLKKIDDPHPGGGGGPGYFVLYVLPSPTP